MPQALGLRVATSPRSAQMQLPFDIAPVPDKQGTGWLSDLLQRASRDEGGETPPRTADPVAWPAPRSR